MFHPTRSASIAALALLTLCGVSACSGASTSPSAQTLVTDPEKVAGAITFSTFWTYADQDLIAGFEEAYPNVDVTLDFTAADGYATKLQTLASSGDLPDVFAAQGPALIALADAGQLYDLDDALATAPFDGDASSWKDSFNADLLSGANAGIDEPNGETFGVPFNAISVAAIYNTEAFDDAGITPPTTFDQLLSNCRALSAAGYIPMSLTGTTWIDWWPRLAWDQTMRDESIDDFSVDEPGYVAGFQKVKDMVDAGCWSDSQISTDIAGETSLFLQGKTAQFVSVPENFLQSVADDASFGLGTYVLPAIDGEEPNRILGGGNANVIAIDKNSENLSAAVAFAKYLTSTAVETELATTQFTIPSINVDLSSDNPLMTAYTEAAGNGFIDQEGYLPYFSTAGQTTFNTEVMPSLILGKITPEQAAAATADLFEK